MRTQVKLEGFSELEKALLQLPDRAAKRAGRTAIRRAAAQIAKVAKANVPVDQGRLKRAIVVQADQGFRDGAKLASMFAVVKVKFTKDYRARTTDRRSRIKGRLTEARYDYQIGSIPQVYGRFVEFGTVDTPAQPFMRPAWDSAGGQVALNRIGAELGKTIEAEAAKLGKRAR